MYDHARHHSNPSTSFCCRDSSGESVHSCGANLHRLCLRLVESRLEQSAPRPLHGDGCGENRENEDEVERDANCDGQAKDAQCWNLRREVARKRARGSGRSDEHRRARLLKGFGDAYRVRVNRSVGTVIGLALQVVEEHKSIVNADADDNKDAEQHDDWDLRDVQKDAIDKVGDSKRENNLQRHDEGEEERLEMKPGEQAHEYEPNAHH
mmetsp:Transcript_36001/g.57875  ORF Transcript_36001/g.57875 Transcript_36001/m.57875 type:complete len:209 (-) Transcript_36001:2340-2966(-)